MSRRSNSTQSVGRRFSSFEFRDSIHLRLAFGRVRRSAWRRAPSQKRLDSRRPVSVSCDVARTVRPRASGAVLPFALRSTSYGHACAFVCDACSSESFDLLTYYVNVHGVQADDQEEVNTYLL